MKVTDQGEQAKAKMSAAGRGVRWNNILVFSSPKLPNNCGQ
jgi:hypothetical protein